MTKYLLLAATAAIGASVAFSSTPAIAGDACELNGSGVPAGENAAGAGALACGQNANASGDGSVAVGFGASVSGAESIGIGDHAVVGGVTQAEERERLE